jgi:hypothetical protein
MQASETGVGSGRANQFRFPPAACVVRNYQTLLVWLLGGKTMAESVKLRVEVVDNVGQDRAAHYQGVLELKDSAG